MNLIIANLHVTVLGFRQADFIFLVMLYGSPLAHQYEPVAFTLVAFTKNGTMYVHVVTRTKTPPLSAFFIEIFRTTGLAYISFLRRIK